jgi:N-acyl-D-amino-acid deacylase
MFDLLITGGDVLDGMGTDPVRSDIGITGDTIAAVGDLSNAEARQVIDLGPACPQSPQSAIVCPGFIDVHSHSDAYLLIEPLAPSKLYQGVTTEVVGNCGASAAPLTGEYRMPSDWREMAFPGGWRSVAEYRALLEEVGPAVNALLLVGHNTLRAGVVGYENRLATIDERRAMAALLARGMDEGARGLSTGLIYSPGMFAPRDEIVELAQVAADHDGIYTSHMRSESRYLLEAIDEALAIGNASGIRVEISHLKVGGRDNWGLIDAALDRIRSARERGQEVAADRYPYTSACTDLDVIFPDWAAEGGRDAVLGRLRSPAERARLREDLLASRSDAYWPTVTIGSTSHAENRRFQGMPLLEVASELGVEPVDAVLHLTETDELKTGAFFFGMNEDNMLRILAEPYVMLGSDASLRAPTGPLSHDYPHPRAYGSFVRFLRMALDGRTVPLPEAVRKMTSLPAQQFSLADRGTLAVGKRADIAILVPGRLRETTGYADPHRLAEGVSHVMVNGVLTLVDGKPTGQRNGRFL